MSIGTQLRQIGTWVRTLMPISLKALTFSVISTYSILLFIKSDQTDQFDHEPNYSLVKFY